MRLPAPQATRDAGDRWLRAGSSLGLLVPSAVLRDERNLLLNPAHARIAEVRRVAARPLDWDRRLFPTP